MRSPRIYHQLQELDEAFAQVNRALNRMRSIRGFQTDELARYSALRIVVADEGFEQPLSSIFLAANPPNDFHGSSVVDTQEALKFCGRHAPRVRLHQVDAINHSLKLRIPLRSWLPEVTLNCFLQTRHQ